MYFVKIILTLINIVLHILQAGLTHFCSKCTVTPVVITTQLAWVDLSGIPLSMFFKTALFYSRRISLGPEYMHNDMQCLETQFYITS